MRQSSVGRPGQTLVIALAVMFLLFFIGALFVAMIARNLNRVSQAGERTSAATLAESGLNWVNTQLTYSELGADWRPSPTWPTRLPPAQEALRQRDPDYFWLSDRGRYEKPWTRIVSGDGRFLVRVDYEPSYRSEVQNEPINFDPLSSHLHVRSVGRPGRIEDDPTVLVEPGSAYDASQPGPDGRPRQILGEYHELVAWKPIGLTDQLWWITNKNKERGPAIVGVPPFQDGQGRTVVYTENLEGGFRSNVDVLFQGPTNLKLYPRSGEGVYIAGDVRMGEIPTRSGSGLVPVEVSFLDPATNERVFQKQQAPSDSTAFDPILLPNGTAAFRDALWLTDNSVHPTRSIRYLEPPVLDQTETGSADSRYRKMTRDTGMNLQVSDGGVRRVVNAGAYGYGDGIYVDNFSDIQHPDNREAVVDEWLRRGPADIAQTGWSGQFYTPSVRESGTVHPVLEVELLPEGIRMTRFDRDVRGRNLGADSQYKTRIFYQAVSKTNANRPPMGPTDLDPNAGLRPAGPTILMPYPANGVLFAEGSLRIKGRIGRNPRPDLGESAGGLTPVQLTVVSGGSIYIEGSLLKAHPASRLALLARDYVCLNPTMFTAVRPYEDVTIEADGAGSRGFHYSVPQNKDLDLIFSSSAPIEGPGMLLNIQHSAGFSDNSSNTSVSMYVNGLEPGNRYDFSAGGVRPPYPASGGQASGGGNPYQFLFFPPPQDPNWWRNSWHASNFQSSPASTVNYERKSFWLPREMLRTGAGEENRIRFHVEPTPDGQPWWLAGASLIPYRRPLNIEVEAVIYAQNGSWFVVPPPWFNENPLDNRELFRAGDSRTNRPQGTRAYGTFPADTDDYPFYREPLNIQVTVRGSITEGQTADGAVKAQWIKRMTMEYADPVSGRHVRRDIHGLDESQFAPGIKYVFDQDLRDWVRYRNVVTGREGVAYVGPPIATAPGPRLETIRQAALQNGQNIVTLPILPRLPTSGTLFRGRPL